MAPHPLHRWCRLAGRRRTIEESRCYPTLSPPASVAPAQFEIATMELGISLMEARFPERGRSGPRAENAHVKSLWFLTPRSPARELLSSSHQEGTMGANRHETGLAHDDETRVPRRRRSTADKPDLRAATELLATALDRDDRIPPALRGSMTSFLDVLRTWLDAEQAERAEEIEDAEWDDTGVCVSRPPPAWTGGPSAAAE